MSLLLFVAPLDLLRSLEQIADVDDILRLNKAALSRAHVLMQHLQPVGHRHLGPSHECRHSRHVFGERLPGALSPIAGLAFTLKPGVGGRMHRQELSGNLVPRLNLGLLIALPRLSLSS